MNAHHPLRSGAVGPGPRRWLALLALCLQPLLAGSAPAQTAPRAYAVLSEFGREVNVVVYQPATGSHRDTNLRESIELDSDTYDRVVVVQARAALQRAEPGAEIWALGRADTDFFDPMSLPGPGGTATLPADLAAALKEHHSTHLLLFTRLRAEAALRFPVSTRGNGRLEGLGFYLDGNLMTRRPDTGAVARGFLSPYAYFRVILIDLGNGQVLATRNVTASTTLSVARAPDNSSNPWDVLTPAQKAEALRRLLVSEVRRAVPAVLSAR